MNKLFPPDQAYKKCADCDAIITANRERCETCAHERKRIRDRDRSRTVRQGIYPLRPECANRMKWVAPFFLCAGCGKMEWGQLGNKRKSQYCAECAPKVDWSSHAIIDGSGSDCYVRVQDAVIVSEVRVTREHVTPIVAAVLKGYRNGW